MFLSKLIALYTVLACLAKLTESFGFEDVPLWFVLLPLFFVLCEYARYLYLAWRLHRDDDDQDPGWPPKSSAA